jgi:phage terminase small subunit
MAVCSEVERAFCIGRMEGLDQTQSAKAAGYSGDNRSLAVKGHELAHRPKVQAALHELSVALFKAEGVKSIKTLIELRDGAENEQVRLKAATEILARAGLGAVTEAHLLVEHKMTDSELDREIARLAAKAGWTQEMVQKALIAPDKNKDVVDAEFTVVSERSADPRNAAKRRTRERRATMTPAEIAADKRRVKAERAQKLKYERALHEAASAAQMDVEEFIARQGFDGLEDLL